MFGKSIYVWSATNPEQIAANLKAGSFESAILHESNMTKWRTPERLALVKLLKSAGIRVFGGAAVYGDNPTAEGQEAAQICLQNDLDCFVFDAESTWDAKPASDTNAVKLLQAFRATAPGVKTGWCWWARWHSSTNVEWHPKKVLWAAMAANYGNADFGLPMAYWTNNDSAANAVWFVEEAWRQWREITDKPLVPIGRAYVGDAGTAKPDAVIAFDKRARELGAVGVSWWSYQHAVALPDVWQALQGLKPFGTVIPPVVPPVVPPNDIEQRLAALELLAAENKTGVNALRGRIEHIENWIEELKNLPL